MDAEVSTFVIAASQKISELPRQSAEEPTSRSVLRRKNTDARSAPNLIDLVGHVDDIEAHRQRTGAGDLKAMTQANIDLRVARRVIPIRDDVAVGKREILPQAGTH